MLVAYFSPFIVTSGGRAIGVRLCNPVVEQCKPSDKQDDEDEGKDTEYDEKI